MPRCLVQAGEGGDGVGGGVVAVGDTAGVAGRVLVGLGPADGQDQAAGLRLDVCESERGQLGAAQGGGEPEQDDRGVAGALGSAAVDRAEELADLGGPEQGGLAAECGADDATGRGVPGGPAR